MKHEHFALLGRKTFKKGEAVDQFFRSEGLVRGGLGFGPTPGGVQIVLEPGEAGRARIFEFLL